MKAAGVFQVWYTAGAREDLLRLFDFLLGRAKTVSDLDGAQAAIDAIRAAIETQLARSPLVYRKAGSDPFLRELIIPLGSAGYVVLYEIAAEWIVNVLAVRHQLEADYH